MEKELVVIQRDQTEPIAKQNPQTDGVAGKPLYFSTLNQNTSLLHNKNVFLHLKLQ